MNSPPTLSVEHSRYGIRETTEGRKKIIPELQLVGHVNYNRARPSFFNQHQHPDVLEIFYIARGKVSWWVEGISSEVCGNELFLVWPHELHGAKDNIVEPSEYYWIQVHLPLLRRGPGGGKPLEKDLRTISENKISATTTLLPLYQSLLAEHARREVYRESVVRETLHLLLSLVIRCSQTQTSAQPKAGPHTERLARSLNLAKENLGEITLKDMVRISGLDAATFRKHFFVLTGSSPTQHLIRLRLQNAKEQLMRGHAITEISHQLGFSSSQYFATVFRKYEGLSPSDFMAKLKSASSLQKQ